MEIVNYVSAAAMPIIMIVIIGIGMIEKKNVYDTFLEGAIDGGKTVIKLFPTLLGIFVAVGALRTSGILEMIIGGMKPILSFLKIPSEIMPLAMLRPISGSASMAVATDIMAKYGVDEIIGKIASVIMGSTETTFYTIAVYTSVVGIKKIRFVLVAALTADIVGMIISILICNIMG